MIKSPWSSWQFGANYFYNNWNGTYKGKGDKAEKYPYEGVFIRSSDLFLRNISPDSSWYSEYTKERNALIKLGDYITPKSLVYSSGTNFLENSEMFATTSIRDRNGKRRGNYGLEMSIIKQEPIVEIELGESINPKSVGDNLSNNLSNINVNHIPSITTDTLTSVTIPSQQLLDKGIRIEPFVPRVIENLLVTLAPVPKFNILLGSYNNPMVDQTSGDSSNVNGGRYESSTGVTYGAAKSYYATETITSGLSAASLRYSEESRDYSLFSGGSNLLKAYFDFTEGGTVTLEQDVTIDSINPLDSNERLAESAAGRSYNAQNFLIGGSRVATIHSGKDESKLINNATVNLVGPLVVGFEIKTKLPDSDGKVVRTLSNTGRITDEKESESTMTEIGGLRRGESMNLKLDIHSQQNGGEINVKRDSNGYTGYKVGLILTGENIEGADDIREGDSSEYVLINDANGKIDFSGGNSIGIQIFSTKGEELDDFDRTFSDNVPKIEVENKGEITLRGIESYGIKLSSKVSEGIIERATRSSFGVSEESIITNSGIINIEGGDGSSNSLSAGIAVLDEVYEAKYGNHKWEQMIFSYIGKVKNKGTINVSGGKGNMGMVLSSWGGVASIENDITNEGTINVRGIGNIGMRLEGLLSRFSDGDIIMNVTAINRGTINVTGSGNNTTDSNIGMTSSGMTGVSNNEGEIILNGENAIGMYVDGEGEIKNTSDIKTLGNTSGKTQVGMYITPYSEGINSGTINLTGTNVTGVYNIGLFKMDEGIISTTGANSVSVYADGSIYTKIQSGTINASDGALGFFISSDYGEIYLGGEYGQLLLNADGDKSLLFYNNTSTTNADGTTSVGKFTLSGNNVTGSINNGASAFYFKDNTTESGTTPGAISDKLNSMFSYSNSKIKLTLDDKSTLFIVDNFKPISNVSDAITLSSVDTISNNLGDFVEISDNSSKNFKVYKVTKSYLNIDTDVNLDNHTPSTPTDKIDNYYRVDFINSKVDVASGKTITGTDASKLKEVIAQANYAGSSSRNDVVVTNNGTIDFSKDGGTAIAVDFGVATNDGTIIMRDGSSITENKVALFGASDSIITNNGMIQLGTKAVGIWGANKISTSESTWGKNIDVKNTNLIKGISGASGLFGIYVDNDTASFTSSTATINHSGNIDFSQNTGSTGIYAKNANLLSSGNISVKDGSIGVNATNSKVNITGGTYSIGKESVAFRLDGTSEFNGTGGSINILDVDSVAYILRGTGTTFGISNFNDNLSLNSNGKRYTYISIEDATLNYGNTKTILGNGSVFINAKNSNVNLMTNANISSTSNDVVGIYSTGNAIGSYITNDGKIELIGDRSTAIYGENSTVTNGSNGSIKIGKNSIGMGVVGGTIINNGNITSTFENAIGMTQDGSGGSFRIENNKTITLTGNQSIGIHSKNASVISNKGTIRVGNSNSIINPSVGIYSENASSSSVIENEGTVEVGNSSIGIYGKDIILKDNIPSTTKAGDGGIAVYSKGGNVTIGENANLSVGKSLGENKEGVLVYLSGNDKTLKSETSNITIGDGSFGYVVTGNNNTVTTGKNYVVAVPTVTPLGDPYINLNKNSVFIYSSDSAGKITNYNNLKSSGNDNYGIYTSGSADNYGNIDFSNGVGNVGLYSYNTNSSEAAKMVVNHGEIRVSKSDITGSDRKYGIGMAAGYSEETSIGSGIKVSKATGHIVNKGTIKVTEDNSIGMYATGKGSIADNDGTIELSGNKSIGIYVEDGATVINRGLIKMDGTGNKNQVGIAVVNGVIENTNTGRIEINSYRGYGLILAGTVVKNYGSMTIKAASGAIGTIAIKEVDKKDMTKFMEEEGLDLIKINAPIGVTEATITLNGVVQTPVVASVQSIESREIPVSSIGMYVDTSGINYTKPINNIGQLVGLAEADLIVGTEATKYTNSKYIQLSEEMIEPYNDTILTSGIEKWYIYSGALSWMASITQNNNLTIENAYLVKVPYTIYAGDKNTTRDTYNFLDGLEQRYGVEGLNSREKQLFEKLNSVGNNEEVLFYQAFDEMMGHQYANTQQRINATGNILDKEFNYLKNDWVNPSKEGNKIKTFGTREEYNTDTAGIIDYKSNSYGVAYVNENETIKLGNNLGWYAGYVQNSFSFKDIGNSKENQNMIKVGMYNTKSFDNNGNLKWTIAGEGFVGQNDMTRRFLVVDEIFSAKSKYYTYGVGLKNEISKEIRTTERTSIRPYGAVDIEYGKFSTIREKDGEMRLEVKRNDYYSIKPEAGVEFKYKQPMAVKTNLVASLGVAYENELGKVANGENRARVGYTEAGYFNIRGEKDDRKGNIKSDFKLGVENTRFGVTFNAGYDTKGKNIRGGIGLRAIF